MDAVRLFTALWPPPDVLDALAAAVAETGIDRLPGLRPVTRERRHLTLAFHGDDDPEVRARDLDGRLSGASAPTLRLAGTGTFPGVLWAGLETDGDASAAALARLVEGAGARAGGFVGHLTLARRSGRDAGPVLAQLPPGPWWTPTEVLLVASAGPHYTPVHRTPLA